MVVKILIITKYSASHNSANGHMEEICKYFLAAYQKERKLVSVTN